MVITESVKGTQKPRDNSQLDEAGKVSLELKLENEFEIKGEAGFWRR